MILKNPSALLHRCWPAVTIAVSVLVASMLPQVKAEPITLTPDQLAIIDRIAKPRGDNPVGYASAPTDPIGAEVRLPFGEGRFITLRRKGSTLREDGSISWFGEVEETGERALLMVWDKALLTGYFAYKGTVFAVESLGGGVHAFAELNRGQQLPDHPDPVARRDAIATDRSAATKPPTAPIEPNVPALTEGNRKALEAKNITIDVMILYTQNVAKRYIREPSDFLALAVDEANQSFKDSGLGNIRLRLVHTEAIDYDTT